MNFLKNAFFAGLLVILPIVITAFVLSKVFLLLDSWVVHIGITTPGVGFALTILIILGVGVVTKLWIGKSLYSVFEWFINRVPPIKLIYNATKDISKTILDRDEGSFKAVVAVPVADGHYAIGFMTNDVPEEMDTAFGDDMVAVVVFQVFSPGSGFTIMIEKDKLRTLDIPVGDAMKVALTAGMMKDDNGS